MSIIKNIKRWFVAIKMMATADIREMDMKSARKMGNDFRDAMLVLAFVLTLVICVYGYMQIIGM